MPRALTRHFTSRLDLDPTDFDTLNAYGVSKLNAGDPAGAGLSSRNRERRIAARRVDKVGAGSGTRESDG